VGDCVTPVTVLLPCRRGSSDRVNWGIRRSSRNLARELHGTRCHASLDESGGLHAWGGKCPNLGGIPLPLLYAGRNDDGSGGGPLCGDAFRSVGARFGADGERRMEANRL